MLSSRTVEVYGFISEVWEKRPLQFGKIIQNRWYCGIVVIFR